MHLSMLLLIFFISFINRAQLKQTGGADIEDLEQVNRKVLSDVIQTSSPEDHKFHFDSWKNNLVEDDPDAENSSDKHMITPPQLII